MEIEEKKETSVPPREHRGCNKLKKSSSVFVYDIFGQVNTVYFRLMVLRSVAR